MEVQHEMKKLRNVLLIMLFIISMGVFAYSLNQVIEIKSSYDAEQRTYDEIDRIIAAHNEKKNDETPQEESKTNWFEFYANQKLVVVDRFAYSLQKMNRSAWQALKNENDDFVGFLWFDNDLFKEPIVQTTNNAYYLDHDFHKNYFARGTVFMNYINKLDDMNLTIYGHNNRYDYTVKFARLNDMRNDEEMYYQNAHFSVYFENEIRRYVICYIFVNKDFKNYNHQFRTLTEDEFNTYFDFVKMKNTVPSIQEIEYGDNFMTLQTCLRGDGSYKVIAIAKEIGRYSYE